MSKPCFRCGGTVRYANGSCAPCSRTLTKAWRKANPEKRAEHRKKWNKANPEKQAARTAKYWAAHPEKKRAKDSAYRTRNIEAVRSRRNAFLKTWVAKNRHVVNATAAKHRAGKKNATPSWANKFFISEAYHLAKVREQVCGGKWHVDHIVPLNGKTVCGLHVESNLQVIPKSVNMVKSNTHWPNQP